MVVGSFHLHNFIQPFIISISFVNPPNSSFKCFTHHTWAKIAKINKGSKMYWQETTCTAFTQNINVTFNNLRFEQWEFQVPLVSFFASAASFAPCRASHELLHTISAESPYLWPHSHQRLRIHCTTISWQLCQRRYLLPNFCLSGPCLKLYSQVSRMSATSATPMFLLVLFRSKPQPSVIIQSNWEPYQTPQTSQTRCGCPNTTNVSSYTNPSSGISCLWPGSEPSSHKVTLLKGLWTFGQGPNIQGASPEGWWTSTKNWKAWVLNLTKPKNLIYIAKKKWCEILFWTNMVKQRKFNANWHFLGSILAIVIAFFHMIHGMFYTPQIVTLLNGKTKLWRCISYQTYHEKKISGVLGCCFFECLFSNPRAVALLHQFQCFISW